MCSDSVKKQTNITAKNREGVKLLISKFVSRGVPAFDQGVGGPESVQNRVLLLGTGIDPMNRL